MVARAAVLVVAAVQLRLVRLLLGRLLLVEPLRAVAQVAEEWAE